MRQPPPPTAPQHSGDEQIALALLRLAVAAERRDDDTGRHIVRMGLMAEAVALALQAPPEWAALLRGAAPMHDVGKIGIPAAVLCKPGPLTHEERAVVNTHPRIGAQILGRPPGPLFALAAEVALTHHERFDGSGYPGGLAGEAIPLSGRIVSVVDYFESLTMDRNDRPAFSDRRALEMLAQGSGHLFDPRVAQVLLDQAEPLLALRNSINVRPVHLPELLPDLNPGLN